MLSLLYDYAKKNLLTVEPGFKPKNIKWLMVFDKKGNYLNLQLLGDTEDRRNKGEFIDKCPDLSQPEMKKGGKGCRHFLVDNLEVVVLYSDNPEKINEEDKEKLEIKHKYFIKLLKQASDVMPELKQIVEALKHKKTLTAIQKELKESKAKSTENITFAILNRSPMRLVEDDCWHDWWRDFRQKLAQDNNKGKKQEQSFTQMRCLISGDLVEPAATHLKIEGLSDVGGLSMGDALISFKQDSFCSYGLAQAANAAVAEGMVTTYRVALNDLIKNHSKRLAGIKVVHWYAGRRKIKSNEDPINILENPLICLDEVNDEKQEEGIAQKHGSEFLSSLETGLWKELADYHYYALTLSGASGRVMVRDWIEGQFGQLANNVKQWFDDLSIVHRQGGKLAPPPKFMAVLGCLVRDLKDLPQPLISKMWRIGIDFELIPEQVVSQALSRAKISVLNDESPNHARMGLLKAFIRRRILKKQKGEDYMIEAYLREDHPDPAYHCGRLMAILADLQHEALGDVGAGVVQRYYGAASSTPALMLGRLLRTGQYHLSKVKSQKPNLGQWYDRKIAEITKSINQNVPKTLSLEGQTLFALGYYQQKAAKQNNQEGKNNE